VDAFKQMTGVFPDAAPTAALEIVETHRGAKEYGKAQQELDAALQNFPDDRYLRGERAELYGDQGKTDAAVAELKKLMTGKQENDLDVYLNIADFCQRGHEYPQAEQALDSADKLATDDKNRAKVAYHRGELFERQKKYDLAEKEFRRVLDSDPKSAQALNYLGYMLADQNVRLPEAHDYIKRAVELEPGNYAFLDSLGWVYFRMNKLDDAERQLVRSLQLSGDKDPTIHDHMGDVYFKEGKLKQAISQWQSSLKAWNSGPPSDLAKEESPAKRN